MSSHRRQGAQCESIRFPIHFSDLTFAYILITLLFFVQFSWQKDPLNDFCRRFGHQTTVIDQRLYIDGGLLNWNPISQYPNNYSNTFLLYNDLTSGTDSGEPQLYANLSKNATIPSVVGGTLWGDSINKRFYLFGGEYYQTPAVSFQLLSYDLLNNDWVSFGPPLTTVISPSWGAGVSISERGEGYYYGGWNSNLTTPGYTGNATIVSNMIKYNMDTNVWTTNAGPDSIPRAEGVMVYLPASDTGLLVYFGGISQPYSNSSATVGSPMSTIFIYDIASSKWYNQTATGDVPQMRRRFCAGATWAPDRSSYNIYLYGGAGLPPNTTGFDDVYILTLPSFIWIKWYAAESYPHNSLSCNVVNSAQMLIIGGTFPVSDQCDAPSVWGTHSLDLGKQNPSKAMWALYRANLTTYVVPDEIISAVGGNSLGAATVTAPATWANPDLPVYFTRTASNPVRTATRVVSTSVAPTTSSPAPSTPTSSPTLAAGGIAGIAVGGVALIALVALGCCFCIRRIRRRRQAIPTPTPYGGNMTATQYAPSQYSAAPYSPQYPQQTHNLPELPEQSQMPVYPMEPKYDPAATQAFRNGSMQEQNPPALGVWTQYQPPQQSPHPSQHRYPSPSHSPPPLALTPARSEPSELSASRPGHQGYPPLPQGNQGNQGSYVAQRPGTPGTPGTPGNEQQYQQPQYQ